MKTQRAKYYLLALGLVALIAALSAFVLMGAQRDVPQRDIASPAPAFAAETMYVAPGQTGESQGGEDEADDQDDAQSDQVNHQNDSDDDSGEQGDDASDGRSGPSQTPQFRVPGTRPGTTTDPDRRPPGNPTPPPGRNPSDPKPPQVIPGINTNLASYATISAQTAEPNLLGITRSSKSGLSRENQRLYFYAVPTDVAGGYSVLVEYANDDTSWKSTKLEGSDGMFGLPVVLSNGAYTDVVLTLVDASGAKTNRTASYRVTYVGRQGPSITLNIQDGQRFDTSPVTLTVSARDADGKTIYPEHMKVSISGAGRTYKISQHGSKDPYEYKLDLANYLQDGDETSFTIEVVAWDTSIEQASTTEVRRIVYAHHSTGEVVGEVTIIVDATTVGLGVVDSFTIPIHQGFPFPQDLVEGLNDRGISPVYSGNFGRSFYLSGLNSGGMFAGQSIPDELLHKIEQDGITYSGSHNADTLSDHDYTSTSGWLYNVNDNWWPSVSLDGYTPSPGDVVYLIYSVAGGKDVGSPNASSGGALSGYCGSWRNGVYTEMHDLQDYLVSREPTCAEDGAARYVCTVAGCGAWGSQPGTVADGQEIPIPATGLHDYQVDAMNSEAPAEGMDGFKHMVCTVCGDSYDEAWPWEGPWPPDDPGGDEPGGDEPGGDEPGGDEPGGGEPGGDDEGGNGGNGGNGAETQGEVEHVAKAVARMMRVMGVSRGAA